MSMSTPGWRTTGARRLAAALLSCAISFTGCGPATDGDDHHDHGGGSHAGEQPPLDTDGSDGERPGLPELGDDDAVAAACVPSGLGTDYEVGPGRAHERLADVPWMTLGPGDTVRVHWRAEPYRDKVLLAAQGTEDAPVRLCGVPGPSGQLPMIIGDGATARADLRYGDPVLEDLAVVLVSRPDYHESPSHIVIEGLHITSAHDEYTYTASDGSQRRYSRGAACIRVQEGQDIVIRGNLITDCGNGLFALSRPENASRLSRDLLIERNYLQDNGVVGSDRQHSVYVQGIGVVYQYNYFGRVRPGAGGGNVKDRSAGMVMRYNWIEGGVRTIDHVEAENFGEWVLEDAYRQSLGGAAPDPERLELVRAYEAMYRTSHIYGNLIRSIGSSDSGLLVHYGHDSVPQYSRAGTLYFHGNTVVATHDRDTRHSIRLFDVTTPAETVEAHNNIVHVESETPGAAASTLTLTRYSGHVRLGTNWISPGWEDGGGQVSGAGGAFGEAEAPVDLDTLVPLPGAGVIDAAGPLPEGLGPAHQLDREYVPHQAGAPRPVRGAGPDLGALEG
jgi:hypothetical protein